MYQVLKNPKRNLLQKSTILNKEANKKGTHCKRWVLSFCIFIAYSLILFILCKVVFMSQYAAVFLSFVLSSGRSEEICVIRPLFVLVSLCFLPESQEHDFAKSQKFLVDYNFFVRVIFSMLCQLIHTKPVPKIYQNTIYPYFNVRSGIPQHQNICRIPVVILSNSSF